VFTLHTADLVRRAADDPEPLPGGAIAVDGDRIVAVGPFEELAGAHPGARTRRWPGTLGPALAHDGPLPEAPTPRERVHALFAAGSTALPAALVTDPADRLAAVRAGVTLTAPGAAPPALAAGARADLVVRDDAGRCLATVLGGRLVHRRA
jgi:hypothetical protein